MLHFHRRIPERAADISWNTLYELAHVYNILHPQRRRPRSLQGEGRVFFDRGDCSCHPVQPFILMNYVRVHRPSAPLFVVDNALLGIVDCQLGIRLSYHRIAHASPLPAQYDVLKVLNVVSFQNRDMGTQHHRVLNLNCHVVGWSWAQRTKCVFMLSLFFTQHLTFFFLVRAALTMVREHVSLPTRVDY